MGGAGEGMRSFVGGLGGKFVRVSQFTKLTGNYIYLLYLLLARGEGLVHGLQAGLAQA